MRPLGLATALIAALLAMVPASGVAQAVAGCPGAVTEADAGGIMGESGCEPESEAEPSVVPSAPPVSGPSPPPPPVQETFHVPSCPENDGPDGGWDRTLCPEATENSRCAPGEWFVRI
jgi:hypothetical protein